MEPKNKPDEGSDDETQDQNFIEKPAILDRYKTASEIVNATLKLVIEKCISGGDVSEICAFGDKTLEEALNKVYQSKKTKKIERGIAFPTCVSRNNVCGQVSPLVDESEKLEDGDLVKVELGVHIGGYPSQVASSFVIGGGKVEGRKADVLLAGWTALQASMRTFRAGGKNYDVTDAVEKATGAYNCKPIEGQYSNKVKRHVIEGNDAILMKRSAENRIEEYEFHPGDVFAIDVYATTAEGRPRESEKRTTVYKRALENTYLMKMKSSRAFFNEVNKKCPTMVFSIRAMEDITAAKLGVKECLAHDLLVPFPVLEEKPNEFVSHFKATICIQQSGTVVLSGPDFDASNVNSEFKVEDEGLKEILARTMDKKEQKKEKKQKKGGEEKKAGEEKKEEGKKEEEKKK